MRSPVLAALLALVLGAGSAAAVCVGVDTDADGVCDDVDNCPADANADQSDVDFDATGDVCDPVDGEMAEPKVSLRLLTVSIRGQAKGYVQTTPPLETFVVADTVSVTIRDGGSTVLTTTWPAEECTLVRTTTRCRSDDRSALLVMKRVASVAGLYRMRVRTKQSQIATQFPGPGTVALTTGDLTYLGAPTLCSVQARALTCRWDPNPGP
jgi:hypothetical protein